MIWKRFRILMFLLVSLAPFATAGCLSADHPDRQGRGGWGDSV